MTFLLLSSRWHRQVLAPILHLLFSLTATRPKYVFSALASLYPLSSILHLDHRHNNQACLPQHLSTCFLGSKVHMSYYWPSCHVTYVSLILVCVFV